MRHSDQKICIVGGEDTPNILVWFEDNPPGHAALRHARQLATATSGHLTVLTVAEHERVIGCGRCLQGTVLWNLEMQKIAREELLKAQCVLGAATNAEFRSIVGRPAEAIAAIGEHIGARTIVLPRRRDRRLDPPSRRNIDRRVALSGSWQVISGQLPTA